ncbi:MAG TPA: GxxExxY protein, partial [Chitinophagaceae bacterium]|nr:GxxExxY protein [Chitinophagaceae bacterium]
SCFPHRDTHYKNSNAEPVREKIVKKRLWWGKRLIFEMFRFVILNRSRSIDTSVNNSILRLTKKYRNELTYSVIGCAIEVHKHPGPGLLESIYEKCFLQELALRGIEYKKQIWAPLDYKDIHLNIEPKGLLLNFHCANIFKEGQRTLVNRLFTLLPDE